ncbi:MAG: hypothetical protein ACK56I_05160, partial [bacterium]
MRLRKLLREPGVSVQSYKQKPRERRWPARFRTNTTMEITRMMIRTWFPQLSGHDTAAGGPRTRRRLAS